MGDLSRMCGMWENKDKNGNKYFSGKLEDGTKIVMFTNTYRDKENSVSGVDGEDLPV